MKTVIVGGVTSGASAATRLRKLDEDVEIVLLERSGHIAYANCGLPYYIGGVVEDADALKLHTKEQFADRYNVDVRVRNEAVSIDRTSKKVKIRNLDDGSEYIEDYDNLILATGAVPRVPDLPGINDPRIMTLRSIEDGIRVREAMKETNAKDVVVCGGGYIGVEVAECLANSGLNVSIIQRSNHILPQLDTEMAGDIHEHIRSKGVNLVLNESMTGFETGDDITVLLESGKKLRCDMVLVSLGIIPDTHLASDAGLEMGSRGTIAVDAHMRTSDPSIYAIGDAVQVNNIVSDQPCNIALAGPATKQGRVAADNIAGLSTVYDGSIGASAMKIFDMTVGSVGLTEEQAKKMGIPCESVIIYTSNHAQYFPDSVNMTVKTVFDPYDGRVLGAQITGSEGVDKRTDVMSVVIRSKMTVYDLSVLELAYAPPYSAAKDPIHYAGFAACNVMDGLVKQFKWDELESKISDPKSIVVDVRLKQEYDEAHLENSINIPIEDLRDRIDEIPKDRQVCLVCHSGMRTYMATRILKQNGYDCIHLSGGLRIYYSVKNNIQS